MFTRNPTYSPTAISPLFTVHSSQAEIFAFSAKERDSETGYSYFGARYYSSDLSIWLSVDPMSDKYPSLSPYTYCADNPVGLVDPNGETPRIYCETNGVGHAFITAGEGKNTVVYTYGRYLGGAKGKSSSNSLDPSGRGVLIKLTGKEAQRYIKHELKDMHAKAYEIMDASDNKVIEHFDAVFSAGRKLTTEESNSYNANPKKYGSSNDARVVDTYDLLNDNCVSKTIEGAKAGGTKDNFLDDSGPLAPDIPNMQSQPTSPSELDRYLRSRTYDKNSNIKDATKTMYTEFVN